MDDEGATKVVIAIERLSNRIAKLDATCVEAAAIANDEPPRVYLRVKLSEDEPYDREEIYPFVHS